MAIGIDRERPGIVHEGDSAAPTRHSSAVCWKGVANG
jgi:hypothetical protein